MDSIFEQINKQRKYRELRNYLGTLACTVDITSKEYANLKRRIKFINDNRL